MVFRVDRRNGRCGATNVNPATGRRDLDMPGSLRAAFGHKELGVYLTVREGGRLTAGDQVLVPSGTTAGHVPPPVPGRPPSGQQKFICGGCYFIYEPAAGLPDQSIPRGTPFSAIPPNWRCPDCGTEKTTFRLHVEPRSFPAAM